MLDVSVSQCILDMINIFEVFLPQLLRYPNPTDPLNGEAAALLMREPTKYEAKVKGMSCVIQVMQNYTLNMIHRLCFTICDQRSSRCSSG